MADELVAPMAGKKAVTKELHLVGHWAARKAGWSADSKGQKWAVEMAVHLAEWLAAMRDACWAEQTAVDWAVQWAASTGSKKAVDWVAMMAANSVVPRAERKATEKESKSVY
jgi:hypothetical protein